MRHHELQIGLLVLLSVALAGCCCPTPCPTSVADARAADVTAAAPGRQVFIDMTTVRIPVEQSTLALGAFRPTSEEQTKVLTKAEATELLAAWQASGDVRVVQAPKMLTLEGQEGTIAIGETIRFADTQVKTGPRGKTSTIVEQKASPVFVGYKLRVVAAPSEDGQRIALDLTETARQTKAGISGEDQARMGAEAFLRDAVLEQKLDLAFEIANDGHVMIGQPTVYEDDKGRFLRVSLLHAVLLDDDEAVKARVD